MELFFQPSEDDDEDDDDRSYAFDPPHSDDSGSTYMTPFNRADIPFDQSDLDTSVGEDAFHEDEEEEDFGRVRWAKEERQLQEQVRRMRNKYQPQQKSDLKQRKPKN